MTSPVLPERQNLTIQFAHVAYALADAFAARGTGIDHFQTFTVEETLARVPDADVLVISGLWRPEIPERAPKLKFVQALSVGYEQFDLEDLRNRGIVFANGTGINGNAVAEHCLSLMLTLSRQLHLARDSQNRHHWRGMNPDVASREQELRSKTLVIYGLGDIGSRIARLASGFGMHVIGLKRDVSTHDGSAAEVLSTDDFLDVLPRADYVVVVCPLTPETRGLIGPEALAAMPRHSRLINVARGACVDEQALISALERGEIAGAGLDTTDTEPLPADSPLWDFANVVITPHTGGETDRYEENLVDLLLENLDRLWHGTRPLRNERT